MLRRVLRNRFLLPAALLMVVGLGATLGLSTGAGAQSRHPGHALASAAGSGAAKTAATTSTTTPDRTTITNIKPTPSTATTRCQKVADQIGYTGPKNSGSPSNSSNLKCVNGQVVEYGTKAITYKALPKSYIKPGEALFEQYCSSCHMAEAQGSAAAPSLIGVGPAVVNFWVTTGRMPAATPLNVQATRKPPRLTVRQANQIAAFITSLAPAAPFIPDVNLKGATLKTGASLFALNCAACHTITGAGDALAQGTFAPPLHYATKRQVAEAIRTGPLNMPRFTGNLSDSQVRDIVAYVTQKIQHPTNEGGFGLGGIGPVAEGLVALLFGVGGLMLVSFWIGDRA